MSKQRLFSIGETSKLFHLSVSTLRHYEALGLLQPEYIDEDSRYRYYGVRQFEVLNTIRYLRMLDLPLDKIDSILQRKDLSRMELILQEQQALVRQKQQELAIIEKKLDRRLQLLTKAQKAPLEKIWIEVIPQQKIICIEESVDIHQPYEIEHSLRKLDTDQATIFLGKVGIGISKEKLLAHQYEEYQYVFLMLEEEDTLDDNVEMISDERCVCIRFCGKHQDASYYYQKLQEYINEHHLEITGFSKEITLIDEALTSDAEQFVTEIRIPVKEDQ